MNERIDNILRELKEAKNVENKSQENSLSGKISERVGAWQSVLSFVYAILSYIWNNFFRPFGKLFRWIVRDVFWKFYRPIWVKYAYYEKDGVVHFSKLRASGTITGSLVAAFLVYQTSFLVADTTLYFLTAKVNETVYLSNAQEIDSLSNVHSVQGCEVQAEGEDFSCSVEDSLYFRIEANTFAEIWSILHHGNIFYSDYVAAAIAPGWERCTVTSYGFRAKLFLRGFEIYPKLLDAKCGSMK